MEVKAYAFRSSLADAQQYAHIAAHLRGGSFPKPLTAEEERIYLKRSAEGDLEARNILIERNLRLVAHIMNKG